MNLLLDTHIILWWLNDDPKLMADHRELIGAAENLCYISAAVLWEISIKSGLGKLSIADNYQDILQGEGFKELSITWKHSAAVKKLPDIHSDPFDRMLIAQAQIEKMTILTVDDTIKKYSVPVL